MIKAEIPEQCPQGAFLGLIERARRWESVDEPVVELSILPDMGVKGPPETWCWVGILRYPGMLTKAQFIIVIGAVPEIGDSDQPTGKYSFHS